MKINLDKEDTPFTLGDEIKTELANQVKRIKSHSNLITQTDDLTTDN